MVGPPPSREARQTNPWRTTTTGYTRLKWWHQENVVGPPPSRKARQTKNLADHHGRIYPA